jgi:hypothetical protein
VTRSQERPLPLKYSGFLNTITLVLISAAGGNISRSGSCVSEKAMNQGRKLGECHSSTEVVDTEDVRNRTMKDSGVS